MNLEHNDRLPVILYLHCSDDGRKESVVQALQKHFSGRYRVEAPELVSTVAHPIPLIETWIRDEAPQLIVAWGLGGNLALKCERDPDIDVVVVNPIIDESLEEVPLCNFNNVFALCSTKDEVAGDSHLKAFTNDYKAVRVTRTDAFSHQLDAPGIQILVSLMESVFEYQKLDTKLMTYEKFEDMVRHRPSPDTPSYYSLKVWTFDNDTYSREEVNGLITYRCPLSSRQAEFSSKQEAMIAIQALAATPNKVCMFQLERLPFGRFDKHPFWVEAWTFDSKGRIIQETTYSASHFHESGIEGKFFGYLPEKMPWLDGQVVGILHRYFGDSRDCATLAVVVHSPKNTADGYKDYLDATRKWIRDGNNPATWLDMTGYPGSDDDDMFIQFGPNNEDMTNFTFAHPLTVFPAPNNLSDEVKAELTKWYYDFNQYEEPEN